MRTSYLTALISLSLCGMAASARAEEPLWKATLEYPVNSILVNSKSTDKPTDR